jgi:adenosylcobinamide-GDP ribazoletransferase
LAFNSIVAIVAGLVLFQLSGTIIIGVALAGAILFFEFIKGKLGGVTGDTLGAANESIEILTLLMIVLMASFL